MEVFERNINPNYSLNEFQDEEERTAVRKAKMESVKEYFRADVIKELGTGSGGRTNVYQVDNKAVKLICCVTKKCNTENLKFEMERLNDMVEKDIRIGKKIFQEICNGSMLRSSNDIPNINANIIPLTGSNKLTWKCESFNRIGVDYAIEMPLAKCMTDIIDTYIYQKQRISQIKPENVEKILTIGIDLCDALIWIHNNGIIHQDIKPENIFWFNDHYCLGDLGIARKENSPQFFQEGTRNYWSPEQENGNAVDHRCDIYSLGLVLYELADIIPMSDHYEQRLHTEKTLPYLKASVPEGLKRILQNACEYEPILRYQTAVEMKEDLCRLMEDTSYIPKATRDTNYFSRKTISPTGATQTSSGLIHQSRNIIQSGPVAFQRQRQKKSFLQPETAWKAGKLWYEESRKAGSRFAGLDIDKRIMPLSSTSSHVMNFPIRVSENLENADDQKPLAEILDDTENLRNMYLIGEGGIGKTTALNFVMEYTYKDKDFFPAAAKNVIPLFIELSKAPADYCNAYRSSHSTFIQRYLYMLLGSVEKQCLLSENSKEMSQIMDKEDTSMTDYMEQLLNTDKENTRYLLLLDGLNEVSKKQLSTKEKDFLGTPSELIVDEIKELLEKHKNITAIITSRADETLYDLDASFKRLYLTGVSEPVIEDYLANCKIPFEMVCKNSRLMETLKTPLFLKLYAQLYNTADISTPGEILYAFFSERSTKYTVRNRIAEIKLDRKKAGDGYVSNSLDEKMQWFILDFILPEIGWYMEKNSLYSINQETIKVITDRILTGSEDTDICGKYGVAFFEDYHKGNDGSFNTRTYAKYLIELTTKHQTYIQAILEYCVYSLGILYVNNQNYGFIHQHIRDFFAAMKITTDMQLALNTKHKNTSINCLREFNSIVLHSSVSLFMSDLSTILNSIYKHDFYYDVLNIYRNVLNETVGIGVKNILDIIYRIKGSLSDLNLSYLDLTNCRLYGFEMENSVFTGSKLTINTMFFKSHNGNISSAIFSPDGKHIFTLVEDNTFKAWNTQSLSEEYVLSNSDPLNPIKNMKYIYGEYSVSGKLIFTVSRVNKNGYTNFIVNIYDANTMKCLKIKSIKRFNSVKNFIDYRNFIKISSDDKYLIISNQNNVLILYPIFQNTLVITRKVALKKFFKHTSFEQFRFSDIYMSPRIAIDPLGRYIAVTIAYDPDIIFLNAHSLKEEFRITLPVLPQDLNYFEHVEYLKFSHEGRYMALSISSYGKKIFILDVEQRIILNSTPKYNEMVQEFKFIKHKSEICLLLVLNNGVLHSKFTNIIVWSFVQDKELFTSKYVNYIDVYDCFEDMILFKNSKGIQISYSLDLSNSTVLNQYQDTTENILGQFFSANKKYLIIYSEKYIQIWTLTTMSDMYEIKFYESIHKVLYASDKLYILCTNNIFQIYDLITRKLITQNNELFNYVERRIYDFYISPKGKYIFVRVEINKYEVYDAQTLKHLQSFKGDFISFNSTETSFIIGYNYMEEARANAHRIRLQEWRRNKKNTCIFECTSNLSEEIFLRASEKLEIPIKDIYSIDGLPYFNITNAIYIPNSNTLLIRLYCVGADRRVLLLLNSDTNEIENIIEPKFENSNYNNGIDTYILNTLSTDFTSKCVPIINLYTLEQFELDHIELTHDVDDIKEAAYNLLFNLHDIVIIINVKTRKYMVVPFLPNLYVKSSVLKNIQLPEYKDTKTFFNVLEMYGAKIT